MKPPCLDCCGHTDSLTGNVVERGWLEKGVASDSREWQDGPAEEAAGQMGEELCIPKQGYQHRERQGG